MKKVQEFLRISVKFCTFAPAKLCYEYEET